MFCQQFLSICYSQETIKFFKILDIFKCLFKLFLFVFDFIFTFFHFKLVKIFLFYFSCCSYICYILYEYITNFRLQIFSNFNDFQLLFFLVIMKSIHLSLFYSFTKFFIFIFILFSCPSSGHFFSDQLILFIMCRHYRGAVHTVQ